MATVRKRILPSGTIVYRVEYKDANGVRRAKQFPKRSDAATWMHQTVADVKDGVHTPASTSITVKVAGKLWIKAVKNERERRPVTIKQYNEHLYNHICDKKIGIGGIKLTSLTASRVKKFYQDMVQHKSRTMADKVLRSLKALISEAQVQGKIKINVALPVKPFKKHSKKKRTDIPALADVRSLLEYAPIKLWRPLLFVSAMCGLRSGEIRALQWSEIDLERGIISVTRSADIYNQVYLPKSAAGTRDIPVPKIVMKELRLWKMATKVNKDNLVFPNTVGNLMAANCIHQNFWKKAMQDLGLVKEDGKGKFRFHDLRHVAASLYIKSGAQPKKLSVIMGHSSINITFDLYGHLWEDLEGDRALAQGVENALFSE